MATSIQDSDQQERANTWNSESVEVKMPTHYADHIFCTQLKALKDEQALKNVDVIFGANGRGTRASGFLLCLLSPVWHAKICGGYSGAERYLGLQGDEETAFSQVLELGVGGPTTIAGGLHGLVVTAMMADRYRIEAVLEAVEGELLRRLTLDTCGEMLSTGLVSGLGRLEGESRRLALGSFERFARTEGFLQLGEDVVASLLDSDDLVATGEEAVFEAVVRWMRAVGPAPAPTPASAAPTPAPAPRGDGGDDPPTDADPKPPGGGGGGGGGGGSSAPSGSALRGEALLDKVRFPLMDRDYLFDTARAALPEGGPPLELRVLEALALQGIPPGRRGLARPRHLGPAALRPRAAGGVAWGRRGFRGAARLSVPETARSLALCGGRVVCGLERGEIWCWDRRTLALQRAMSGHTEIVRALTAWGGRW